MKKNIFDVFKEMNDNDTANKTSHLGLCNQFVGARTVKAGAIIEMATETSAIMDIHFDKTIPILLLINKAEYERILNS